MRLSHFAAVPLLLGTPILSHASDRPTGTNCELSAPPSISGEDYSHGITVRIYPRAKDIGPTYRGCQVVWVQTDKGWSEVAVTAIENGDAVRIWSPDNSDPRLYSCRYQHGHVVSGNRDACVAPEALIAKSMAPGCVSKRLSAVATEGISAPTPSGCEYE